MKQERIDSSSRFGIVTRTPDGRLTEESDPACLAGVDPAQAQDTADAHARAEIARTRLW